jgi:hypothetical protein
MLIDFGSKSILEAKVLFCALSELSTALSYYSDYPLVVESDSFQQLTREKFQWLHC